jgi:hypothetical protein
MQFRQIGFPMLLCSSIAVMALSISCGRTPVPQDKDNDGNLALGGCKVDLSNPPLECPLSKWKRQRITWINPSTTKDYYACINPAESPFNAYGWFIPRSTAAKKSERDTDPVRQDVTPDDTVLIRFWRSDTICGAAPPPPLNSPPPNTPPAPLTSPHIIIKGLQ